MCGYCIWLQILEQSHANDANFSGIVDANQVIFKNLPVSYNQNGTGQQTFSSEAVGQFTALGTSTIAPSFGTVAIGTYNTGNFETSEFSLSNPAFVIIMVVGRVMNS